MPTLSQQSEFKLATCNEKIRKVIERVSSKRNTIVTCGFRDQAEQDKLFAEGKTQKQWPEGNHNTSPSDAVDIVPVVAGKVPWPEFPDGLPTEIRAAVRKYAKQTAIFAFLAGYIQAVSDDEGYKCRWGGDWDSDGDTCDNSFDDLVHFEIT